MLAKAPDKLRADMQRFYGLDLDQLGVTIRVRRMADLAANLPDDAKVWGGLDPRATWDSLHHLLADIADNAAFLAWTKTKEGNRKGARWNDRIQRPGMTKRKPQGPALSPEGMLATLSRPRG